VRKLDAARAERSYTVVLDAGAFIAFERKNRVMIDLAQSLIRDQASLVTSAGVLAQVWRNPARQGALAFFLTHVHAVDLTAPIARLLGRMMTVAKTTDVVDAHIAHLAVFYQCPVLTSDPKDLLRLDPGIRVELV
jgi:predicted nucleic acid-binding protein